MTRALCRTGTSLSISETLSLWLRERRESIQSDMIALLVSLSAKARSKRAHAMNGNTAHPDYTDACVTVFVRIVLLAL